MVGKAQLQFYNRLFLLPAKHRPFLADSGGILGPQCTTRVGTVSLAGLSRPHSQKPCYGRTAIRGPAPRPVGEDTAKGGTGVLPPSLTATPQAVGRSLCGVALTQGKHFLGLPVDPKCLLPKTHFHFPFRKQPSHEDAGCVQPRLLV